MNASFKENEMKLKVIFFISFLFLSIYGFSQWDDEQRILAEEYLGLLQEQQANDRIDEIESVASNINDYFALRHLIAKTHFYNYQNRESFSKPIYKSILEPNIGTSGTDTAGLAMFYLMRMEQEYTEDLEDLLKDVSSMNDFGKLSLAAYYFANGQSQKALQNLPDLEIRLLGISLIQNYDYLSVEAVASETSVPFLKSGDRIFSIENTKIKKINDIRNELMRHKDDEVLSITFERDGEVKNETFKNPKKNLNTNFAPFIAQILAYNQRIDEALEIIKKFESADIPESLTQNNYFLSLQAVASYVKCFVGLDPSNLNINKRKMALDFCKQSISQMSTAFRLIENYYYQFEVELVTNQNLLFVAYSDAISLISKSYAGEYFPSGFPIIFNEDEYIQLIDDYIPMSPLIFANEERLLSALVEIYKDGDVSAEKQYINLSSERLNALESLINLDNHIGYISRYHLYYLYTRDEERKDGEKALNVARKMYELDLEKDPNVQRYLAQALYEVSEYEEFYLYAKDIFGQSKNLDTKIVTAVIDGYVNIDKQSLDKLLDADFTKNLINKINLYPYIAYKSFYEMTPFKDDERACDLVMEDVNFEENYISQLIFSICVLDGKITNSKYNAQQLMANLSKRGSSTATYFLYGFASNKTSIEDVDYDKQKDLLNLAMEQLENFSSRELINEVSWLESRALFDISKNILLDDLDYVKAKIKEEQDYIIALQKAKEQKERERLQAIRRQNRQARTEKAGSAFLNLLEFTAKAALVVGAVALTGEALEESSPEVQQAFVDSLVGSVDSSYSSYSSTSSKSSSYQCRSAQEELSRARRSLGTSSSLIGHLECSNAGGSCMTPLPRQCSNRAYACKAGDYSCTSRENQNYFYCQQRARQAAENKRRNCEQRREQEIRQCNLRVTNNKRSSASNDISQAQSKVNLYCY